MYDRHCAGHLSLNLAHTRIARGLSQLALYQLCFTALYPHDDIHTSTFVTTPTAISYQSVKVHNRLRVSSIRRGALPPQDVGQLLTMPSMLMIRLVLSLSYCRTGSLSPLSLLILSAPCILIHFFVRDIVAVEDLSYIVADVLKGIASSALFPG